MGSRPVTNLVPKGSISPVLNLKKSGLNGELQLAPGHCPDASIVGTAEAITPLLAVPVKGHVYLARPWLWWCGTDSVHRTGRADGNLYQLYLELGGTG